MHEYVYADRILQSALQESGGQRPTLVSVEVGEMLGLTEESLSMAYEVLSKGTKAEGSKLKVAFTEGAVDCPKCGYSGRLSLKRHEHVVDPAFACPECGSSLHISKGLEVRIVELKSKP